MPARRPWESYPSPVLDAASGCLRWQGPHHSNGYGRIGGRSYAHRVAWEREHGPIASGMTIDHVAARGCVHRDCVATSHMQVVSQGVNARRGRRIAAQIAATHCPAGHAYTGHNLILRRGKRECRQCTYDRNARNRARRRAAA